MKMVKRNIVVFTGAGMSTESGISTFRDKDGLWTKYDAMRLASIDGFRENPEAVLEFYNARRMQLTKVQMKDYQWGICTLRQMRQ